MNSDLTVSEKCVLLRNDIEIWVPEEIGDRIGGDWMRDRNSILNIKGSYINGVDITGVFCPTTLEEHKRRKRGEWRCQHGEWHNKNDECRCWGKHRPNDVPEHEEVTPEQRERAFKLLEEARRTFGKGKNVGS